MADLTKTNTQVPSQSSDADSAAPLNRYFIVNTDEGKPQVKQTGSASMNDCFRFMLKDNERINRRKKLEMAEKKGLLRRLNP